MTLCAFFWVIPRRLNFYMPTFRNTLIHLHRRVGIKNDILHTYPPMTIEQCSETSAYKVRTPGNYPEESAKHSENGESLKSRSMAFIVAGISELVLLICAVMRSPNLKPFTTCPRVTSVTLTADENSRLLLQAVGSAECTG